MKHKRGTKLLSILLSFVMLLGLLPAMALTASAQLEPVSYMEATVDATTHEVTFSEKTCTDYTVVTSGTTTWNTGWYVVSGVVNIGTITVNGTANLILCDGAKLTSSGQIKVEDSNVLNIYGQSAGSGSLAVKAGKNDFVAGIGGQSGKTGGTISIHGGTVTATPDNAYSGGVGIGGVYGGAHVTIYGGTVTATGGRGAGIGSSRSGNGGEVTIYGGTVTASSSSSAGIGGGHGCAGSTVTIYGGTVVANGGDNGAGIGGGGYAYPNDNSGGTVTIYGGNVTATGGSEYGAGIGGGYQGAGADVTVLGGTVNATGGKFAAGIGGGSSSSGEGDGVGGTVIISGGTVTATGGESAAGIGGAIWKDGGTVTISGGTVIAAGGGGEGIGKGQHASNSGTLTLGEGMYLYGDASTPLIITGENSIPEVEGSYARKRYMTVNNVVPHTHVFSDRQAEGDTITAVCTNTDSPCTIPETEGKHIATLTISAPTEESGGKAVLTLNDEYAFGNPSNLQIKYSSNGGSTWTTTAPSGPGFYRAKVDWTPTGGETLTAQITYGVACITYATGLENGTISGSPDATVGATITPTITPATGYELDALTVIAENHETVTVDGGTFVMPEANVTVSGTFKKINSAITFTQPTGGTVTAMKDNVYVTTADYGDAITLGNIPADGYSFTSYSVTKTGDSSTLVTVTNGTFTMPAYPVTVTAAFTPIDYTVTVTQPEAGGTIGADKTSNVHIGNEITLSATPAAGYELDAFTVTKAGGGTVTVTDNKFTMPASDVTVTAAFKPADYHVTITSPIENGSVTASIGEYAVTADTDLHYQDPVTLTVAPDEGFGLKSITTTSGTLAQTALDSETGVLTYVLTMGAADATVTAEFSELTVYTIFYNAGGSPDAVSIKPTGGDGDGYPMTSSAKLGSIDCWSTQVLSGDGLESLSYAFKAGNGEWTTLNIPVVSEVPNTLAAGSAVAIAGEANAFVVAFAWGEGENDNRYYLVTSNTASLDVPNPANTDSETFTGWTYLVPSAQAGGEAEEVTVNKADGNTTTVQLNKITQTTIASAIWTPNSYTVRIDPDNGSAATTETVTYGANVTKPDTPTKAGYEFAGWVLAKDAVEKIGDKTLQFSAGTAFDFDNTGIINDLYLKAKWKHVHAYACLQLDDSVFGGAFKDYYGYKGQLHIKLCTSMDDYSVEAHNFVNGKCACGASILDNKVKLTEFVGNSKIAELSAVKDSIVSIIAPQNLGQQRFGKWQYSADGQNWRDLTAMRGVAFSIPADMSMKAVYESEPFKLSINSFKYRDKYIAFQFDYSVPDGFTVVDGGLMIGDNVRMKFWDCTIKSLIGNQYEPSLRDAVKVFGGGTIANKLVNYQTINEPGLAKPIKKPLATFGKTGTVALAWQPYDKDGYNKAINAHGTVKNFDQQTYPTYAMGYIICRTSQGGYVGFMTNAISATLESPAHSHVTTIPVS